MTSVLVLAAGQGSRLGPLTKEKPKCLLEFLGKSLLDYQIDIFESLGINKIHIVTGYFQDKINNKNLKKIFNQNYKTTNMVYSLFYDLNFLKNINDDLIVTYGDIIFEKQIISKLLNSTYDFSLCVDNNWREYWELRFENPLDDAETLEISKEIYIQEIGKKTNNINKIQAQYMGLFKIKNSILNEIIDFYINLDKTELYDGQQFKNMYMTSFLQALINNGMKIKPIFCHNGWLEFDTENDLRLYNNLHNKKRLNKLIKI